MVKKILFCATVDYHFKAFHLPYLKWFKEQGWEVHIAANGDLNLPYTDEKFNIPIARSPFRKDNLKAFQQLKRILHLNQYEIVHCHTPMGGVIARLAARKERKKGTKVIYTAHGFHFCKGSPAANWMIYYPIEKSLALITDCLITINREDFELAHNHRFRSKLIKHVFGVGVDTERFRPLESINKIEQRRKFGYRKEQFLIFYAAEFNKNKNQQFLIRALSMCKHKVPHARLLLAGEGPLIKDCKILAKKLNVDSMVDFLGFRKDIDQILPMCDLGAASSAREGLPVNIMEAMACGLPILATKNRGHHELIISGKNGWLIDKERTELFAEKMITLADDEALRNAFGDCSRQLAESHYSVKVVLKQKSELYMEYMRETEELEWGIH